MKEISDQLAAIAEVEEVNYLRASSIEQANILTHYENAERPLIIYVGGGAAANYYEGAEPLQNVAIEVYCVIKTVTTDPLAEQLDDQLVITEGLATQIIYNFDIAVRDITEFNLQPLVINDDLLIGHLLTFTPTLPGNACKG